jgi:hypothetical protein
MSDYAGQARDTYKRVKDTARADIEKARTKARDTLRAATYAYRTVTGGTAGRALSNITSEARRKYTRSR